MVNTNKLKGKLKEMAMTQKQMAKVIGISERSFNSKINKGSFKANEIAIMIDALGIDDPVPIFFVKEVTQ